MILHALNSYYERMASASDSGMPSYGTSVENISFALVIAEDGTLKEVEDLREKSGNRLRPRRMPVPAAQKKASGIKPNFLWDTTSYVLGMDDKGNPERTDRCRLAFLNHTKKHCDDADIGMKAIITFLEVKNGRTVSLRDDWQDICGTNIVFRLDGTPGFIHERPAARAAWEKCMGQRGEEIWGQCLISGDAQQRLARLHPSIKGVRGAQSSGASIVSFNHNAFVSYGKQQSFNAPVGQHSAFAYTTALNSLLSVGSRQKIILADTTYIFWAKRPTLAESLFADLFDPPVHTGEVAADQDDQQTAGLIRGLLKAVRDGRRLTDFLPDLDENVQFYILGLAPNAARLSMRFWEANSLGLLLRRVGSHYEQLSIVRQFDTEPEFPPLWRLLVQTATLGKTENISPVLAGGMTRSMLTGARYPQSLLPVVLGRIRTEHDVTYYRAALLKAYLMRNKDMKEVPVSLDPHRTDLPYLLGRLFSVLEKAQEDAIPKTNATIKDRYLASASATPGQVFHMLIKNCANHIAKLKRNPETAGIGFNHEKRIQDIIDGFSDYPKTMKPEEQGLFMIGYYHQRKNFYQKKHRRDKDGHDRQSL
jgi:CRISPR-associated protein Csd1